MAGRLKSWLKHQARHLPGYDAWQKEKWLRREFALERALLRGRRCNSSPRPSIIHFSVHKAATQYVKTVLSRCARENGMQPVRLNDYAFFKTGMPYLQTLSEADMARYRHLFHPRGYLYSVFAGMVEGIADFEMYRSVLVIRDPRDALTSEYFSILHSHPPPGAKEKLPAYFRHRAKARQVGIDRYVLSECERVGQVYHRYLRLLSPRGSVLVLKYEDMVADFQGWLDRLLGFSGLEISGQLRQELLEENRAARPKKEDATRHVRQVTPGDHRRKLAPETIAVLNGKLTQALAGFGYV